MIKKYSEKLIDLCMEIDFEYDILMDLSEKNKENTKDYTNNIHVLKELMESAINYCITFKVDELQNMLYYVSEKLEETENGYYYEIASSIIDYTLNKKYKEERKDLEENVVKEPNEYDEDYDEITDTEDCDEEYKDYDEITDTENYDEEYDEEYEETYPDEIEIDYENKWLETYPDYLDDYYDEAMGIIYTSAARKMFIELINLKPKNKKEKKLQNKLLKLYQTQYRYDFLTRNVSLELMSIDAKFNPFRIYVCTDDDYSPLYFNESINILKSICNKNIDNLDEEDLEDSFEIMCLFEMLDYLDIEQLNKLKEACVEFCYSKSNTLGQLCLSKIQSKTGN